MRKQLLNFSFIAFTTFSILFFYSSCQGKSAIISDNTPEISQLTVDEGKKVNSQEKMKDVRIEFVHVRHATSIIKIGDKVILIDPMLSEKDSLPAVQFSDNELKNPRVNLPYSSDSIIKNVNYLLLTHLHFDHFDKKAIDILSKQTPILCSGNDVDELKDFGFRSIYPIENQLEFEGIKITQYSAIHGKGILKFFTGKGSSYLINYKGFKIFLTGDCLLTDSLLNNLKVSKPDVIIANAGAAKFKIGKPITMSINDIKEISKNLPKSKIFVVHLDALNHCSETRAFSKKQTQKFPTIYIPGDGETINIK